MQKRKSFKFFILFLISTHSYGQQDAQLTHSYFNMPYYNPAAFGFNDEVRISFFHRVQWYGYSSSYTDQFNPAPTTQFLSVSMPFSPIHGGMGLALRNEEWGGIKTKEVQLGYSFHKEIGAGKLGLGVKLGGINQTVSKNQWRPSNRNPQDDALLNSDASISMTKVDVGAGVWYQLDGWYIGLAMNHINKPKYNYIVNENVSSGSFLENHFYFSAAYTFSPNNSIKLIPNTIIKYDKNKPSVELGTILQYKSNKYWGGVYFRSGSDVSGMVGIGLLKQNSLKIGYSIDLTYSGIEAKAATSHEIMLQYALPALQTKQKPSIKTPRFDIDGGY